jgi:hypothetical protein
MAGGRMSSSAHAELWCRNLSIIPVGLNKKPLVARWKPYQERQATEQEIHAWEAKNPPGWALITGALSDVIVLDFDGLQGVATMRKLELDPHVQTGSGGYHVWVQHPGWHVPTLNAKTKIELNRQFPGMDIRGDGGYAVFEGRNESGEYRRLRALADLYQWPQLNIGILPFIGRPAAAEEHTSDVQAPPVPATSVHRVDAERLVRRALDRAGAEGRNNAGFGLALQLRDNGYSQPEAVSSMASYVDRVGKTNLKGKPERYTLTEAGASVREAYRSPAREPWERRTDPAPSHATVTAEPSPGATVSSPAVATNLESVIETFRRWLYLPDTTPLLAVLGTVAANLLPGDPVWLLLIGPPGGGKTELLQPLGSLPRVHMTSTLTEASLLSGTPSKDKAKDASGGLLRSVGDFGVLLCKDFGSVLSMNRDSRTSVLAALREVYDGSWTRHVGVDGGRTLHWQGKLGLIGACTSTIDSHHAVIAAMGERFIMFRLADIGEDELAARALDHQGSEVLMRTELCRAVSSLFSGLTLSRPAVVHGSERERLIALATLAVRCRSAVERDGYTRQVELIPQSEAPGRLALCLARLLDGMTTIGASRVDAWRVVAKCAVDCVPALRLRVLGMLAGELGAVETAAVATAIRYPTQTTRRALEDLTAHGVVKRVGHAPGRGGSDIWRLTDWTFKKCDAAEIRFPEMLVEEDGSPEMSEGE